MRLDSEFIRLPLNFDADRLLLESTQFSEYDWDYHPLAYQGNTALSLVSSGGDATNSTSGAMTPTVALDRTPYIQQVMSSLGTVVGRSRLMRLAPHSVVPAHSDTDYAWRSRVRIHIPIITDPQIVFSSIGVDGEPGVDVHMRAGEAWIFDNWREHTVTNPTDVRRIHLVIDTVGTAQFWRFAKAGWSSRKPIIDWAKGAQHIAFNSSLTTNLTFENFNSTPVRPPDEIESMMREFMLDIAHLESNAPSAYQAIQSACDEFCYDWRGHWSLYWCLPANIEHYEMLASQLKASLKGKLLNVVLQSNRVSAFGVISNWLDQTTDRHAQLAPDSLEHSKRHDASNTSAEEAKASTLQLGTPKRQTPELYTPELYTPEFKTPVFIVSAPRAGSTMLFEALKTNKLLWTLGDEIDRELESIEALHPRANGYQSNALAAQDASQDTIQRVTACFVKKLRNSTGIAYSDLALSQQGSSLRLLEKTLKNSLRIPFLKAVFPDAKFIFVHRETNANIASLIDAWASDRFVTYSNLVVEPDNTQHNWSLPLTLGWQESLSISLPQRAMSQWSSIIEKIVTDLEPIKSDTLCLSYDSLIDDPMTNLKRACEFCGVPFGPKMQQFSQTGFPYSKFTLSDPSESKWLAHEDDLNINRALYQSAADRLERFLESV